jgi:hypothetical protein
MQIRKRRERVSYKMDGIDKEKIISELNKMFPDKDLNNIEFIRSLNKEIALRVDPFRGEFSEKYVDHKAQTIFKRIISSIK